jgi:hypothetical protein
LKTKGIDHFTYVEEKGIKYFVAQGAMKHLSDFIGSRILENQSIKPTSMNTALGLKSKVPLDE